MCSINYHYHIVTIIVIMCDSVGERERERERERIGYRCAIFNIVFVHAMLSFFFFSHAECMGRDGSGVITTATDR